MLPTLPDGAHIRVEPREAYQLGDIVVFGDEFNLIAHRLVAHIGKDCLITLGDNCMYIDPPIPIARARGIVVAMRVPGDVWRMPLQALKTTDCKKHITRVSVLLVRGVGAISRRLARLTALFIRVLGHRIARCLRREATPPA